MITVNLSEENYDVSNDIYEIVLVSFVFCEDFIRLRSCCVVRGPQSLTSETISLLSDR